MAQRSRTKPADGDKSAKKRDQPGEKTRATTEDFEREGLEIASKE